MSRTDKEIDEFGKRIFSPLHPTPPLNPATADEIKAKYLKQSEGFRQARVAETSTESVSPASMKGMSLWKTRPILKVLTAAMLALLILLVGSSLTVYAAQDSLPGQPLYPLKSWSEDLRLSLTGSPQAKLRLTLEYTNRRMNEISTLMDQGIPVSQQSSERFQQQLEEALQYATQLDDTQMIQALENIKRNAENQGITLQDLIIQLPAQAEPAAIQLQQRLDEQVQLSNYGEADPKGFRERVRERARNQQQIKHNFTTEEPENSPGNPQGTPQSENDNMQPLGNTPTEVRQEPVDPGTVQATPGNGQGQPSPGGGNHDQDPQHTPKP
ncbi:MAG: hypothetical protein C3F13_13555 [Anaerolineales bacterium]|nr:MAG: hypothetical protein C3F13_13555 [Anaerolineales bacterium]